MDYKQESLKLHESLKGKLAILPKIKVKTRDDLSIAYTPGVAQPCIEIAKNKDLIYKYSPKGNAVAVVTDGSAVLGLGNIGPEAGYPVMEGKSLLFKEFGNIDSYPICVASQEVEDIVKVVKLISPGFGGINLEDISAPRCFEVEARLKKELDIPVFHDDQHGTAIVVLAGLLNAIKLAGKENSKVKIVISGAGAAGMSITKLLIKAGVGGNIILLDSKGAIYKGRTDGMNSYKENIAKITNKNLEKGKISEVIVGADIFIGVSQPNIMTESDIKAMNSKPIVFAMANPDPEIRPDVAIKAGVFIMATGRSDFPNQVNNVLAFPGIFRGALDVRAKDINDEMKLAAAYAIANFVKDPSPNKIIPSVFDGVVSVVAPAVMAAARKTGVARL